MINEKMYAIFVIIIMMILLIVTRYLSDTSSILLIFIVTTLFSFSYIKNVKNQFSKKEHINFSDERNKKIRDKVNATMSYILFIIMTVLTIICIAIQNYIPAIILSIVIFSSPLMMYLINFFYEKKY